ncbi:MAG: PAS domain S-box protein, partial [Chloroflexi bacterium]|nr:PAS domain S-box protein [Chloroflexota bacterium]
YPSISAFWHMILSGQAVKGEFINRTKDGRLLNVEGSANPILDEQGNIVGFLAIQRDITERKQAEAALQQSEERYRRIVETAVEGIWVIDAESKTVFVNARMAEMLGYTADEMMGQPLFVFTDEEDQSLTETLLDRRRHGVREQHDFKFRRKDGSHVWTILSATPIFDEAGRYSAALGMVTNITERKSAEESVKQSFEKLQRTLEGTIQAMAMTVEMKDPYTAGHQQNVGELAAAIGQLLGLSEDRIEAIRLAGLIHDIGKIGIPAEILSKPGRMSDTEFTLIKAHPQVGYDILKRIEFPWPIAQIVHQHHERMDGSGYPLGLSGDEILLEARVLAVADVVEAIASHRPYRPALGIGEALEQISQYRGILYDPQVVEACLKLFTKEGFKFEDRG